MASPVVNVGTGASITFSSSFFARITNVDWSGITRGEFDTTAMSVSTTTATNTFGNRTFIPSKLIDAGGLSIEMQFNPDTRPPIDAVAETVTVTWAGGGTWVGSAFLNNFEPSAPVDNVMVATATLKFSGAITITAGA